jgi:acetyl esterase/lipase
MKPSSAFCIRLICFATWQGAALFIASAQSTSTRTIPARPLPVPTTVSSQLQTVIAPAWQGSSSPVVRTTEQWKVFIQQVNQPQVQEAELLKQRFQVSVKEDTIAGVHVYRVSPPVVPEENRHRLLLHIHGGAYVLFGGEAAIPEAILMAHYARMEVISIDYRMPPDHPFPAALDDTIAVWREILRTYTPRDVGLFGTSAGGGLTLATVIKMKELSLPLPGALMAGTPWSDLTKTGDSYYTNALIDNVLGTEEGSLDACAKLYAGSHDLTDPLLSPVNGDLSGFPPTVLLTGTRDLFLSNTVRVHQKLLHAGVPADLLVFEGESHAQYLIAFDAPESAIAFQEVTQFFERNLER